MFVIPALLSTVVLKVSFAHPHAMPASSQDGMPTSPHAAGAVVRRVVNAMGGIEALDAIRGFSYAANDIYRSSTLTQTYNLYSLDQSVASAGSETMSFELDGSDIKSRIDRAYAYNEYWTWAFPDLRPTVNMSLVVQDTANGSYARFVRGSNNFFSSDLTVAQGYADEFLTDYLIHQTHQFALPWLLKRFLDDSRELTLGRSEERGTLRSYLLIEHVGLGLKLLIDPDTRLAHAVRSPENHEIYGMSTSDVILTGWRNVSVGETMQFLMPHRFQTVYNSRYVLEDFLVDSIAINPTHPASFFDGQSPALGPEDTSVTGAPTPMEPARSAEYPRSEVHEFFESGLWGGPFGNFFNESSVVINHPYHDFQNIMTVYVGYPDYVQLLVEHETGFIITDAPAHRSKIILDWLATHRPGKSVTHVVPSHHHRDHAGGVYDYIRAGATLVVPHVAKDFYGSPAKVPRLETYDEHDPFIFKDGSVEFRSYWKDNNPHAEDWSFAVATKAHAMEKDLFVLFNADVVNPGTEALRWDAGAAREFLLEAIRVGVPRSTLLVGAHGSSKNGTSTSEALVDVARTIGMDYPDLKAKGGFRLERKRIEDSTVVLGMSIHS